MTTFLCNLISQELEKLAKKLKKEKVNVDVVNFGEISPNTDKLSAFVTALNGKEGQTSYLVTVPPGPTLSDSIRDSPIVKVWFSILQYQLFCPHAMLWTEL